MFIFQQVLQIPVRRIFHGVEENRSDFAADAHTARAFVWYAGNVFTEEPQ